MSRLIMDIKMGEYRKLRYSPIQYILNSKLESVYHLSPITKTNAIATGATKRQMTSHTS
jgi:hypothetical protein